MVDYYPPREELSIGALNRMYPGFNLVDAAEVRRNISVQEHKDRGKGAPKKAKDKCTSPFLSCSFSEAETSFSTIPSHTEEEVVAVTLLSVL